MARDPNPARDRCPFPASAGAAASAEPERLGDWECLPSRLRRQIGGSQRLRGNRQVLNERRRPSVSPCAPWLAASSTGTVSLSSPFSSTFLTGSGSLVAAAPAAAARAWHVEPDDLLADVVDQMAWTAARWDSAQIQNASAEQGPVDAQRHASAPAEIALRLLEKEPHFGGASREGRSCGSEVLKSILRSALGGGASCKNGTATTVPGAAEREPSH